MDRRRTIDEWISTIARGVGLTALVAFAVKWFLTGSVEPLLVSAMLGLYGLGKGGEALAILRSSASAPTPARDDRASEAGPPR